MAKKTRICRVCGKEYEACRSERTSNATAWKDVACSRECGEEYFRRVAEARSGKTIEKPIEDKSSHVVDDIADVEPKRFQASAEHIEQKRSSVRKAKNK